MPRTAGQRSSEKRKRNKRNAEKTVCGGDTCCQAVTKNGTQCVRRARIKLDLTKGKKIYGYKIIPKTGCCFYCIQHTAIITGFAMYKIGWLLAEKNIEWDEYITLHPDYLDQKIKEMGGKY